MSLSERIEQLAKLKFQTHKFERSDEGDVVGFFSQLKKAQKDAGY